MADDDRHDGRLVAHFGDLVREWQMHRDAVNRAINLLSREILELRDWKVKDERQRIERQEQIDTQLAAIRNNQRWWLRFVVLIALMGAGIAIGWWLL